MEDTGEGQQIGNQASNVYQKGPKAEKQPDKIHRWVQGNLLALQSLLDGELLATVPALKVLLLCGGPLVEALEVGCQDLLTGKAALTQQAGVILLLYDELCRNEKDASDSSMSAWDNKPGEQSSTLPISTI